jgi:hypothetical protein
MTAQPDVFDPCTCHREYLGAGQWAERGEPCPVCLAWHERMTRWAHLEREKPQSEKRRGRRG